MRHSRGVAETAKAWVRAVLAYFTNRTHRPDPGDTRNPPLAMVNPDDQALLQRFAPDVWLHSMEDYFPSSIDFYLEHCELVGGPSRIAQPSFAQLADSAFGERRAWYLDVTDTTECLPGTKPDSDGSGPGCYAYIQRAAAAAYLYYWFFYPYNGSIVDRRENEGAWEALRDVEILAKKSPFGDRFHGDTSGHVDLHQGDWERVIVAIPTGQETPDKMYFAQHSKGAVLPWASVVKHSEDHPVVYSARHSHASYPTSGEQADPSLPPPFDKLPADVTVHDLTNEGFRWKTWLQLSMLPYDEAGPTAAGFGGWQTDDQQWLKFSGRWGKRWPDHHAFCESSGPAGPAYHDEWAQGHPDTAGYGETAG